MVVLCFQGYGACAYLKWVDKEWQGRPRQVIGKLAEENVALQKFVFDKDAEIMRLKEERKAMIMKHKKEIRTREGDHPKPHQHHRNPLGQILYGRAQKPY